MRECSIGGEAGGEILAETDRQSPQRFMRASHNAPSVHPFLPCHIEHRSLPLQLRKHCIKWSRLVLSKRFAPWETLMTILQTSWRKGTRPAPLHLASRT